MIMGLNDGLLAVGTLVVPERALARLLTDRIGNYEELKPYLMHFRDSRCKAGVLEIVVIGFDATSHTVQKIPKGTDGRAER